MITKGLIDRINQYNFNSLIMIDVKERRESKVFDVNYITFTNSNEGILPCYYYIPEIYKGE